MTRSIWKGPFLDASLLKAQTNKISKIWSRTSVIPAFLIGETIFIHNGKEFKRVVITREKVGFKFGEFSFTRKYTNKQKIVKQTAKKKNKSKFLWVKNLTH